MDDYTAKRLVEQRRGMLKVQKACDEQNLPYPSELIEFLTMIARYRNGN